MALGEQLGQVEDTTKGVQEGGALQKTDAAKGDVTGQRKKTQSGEGEGEKTGEVETKPKESSLKINIKLDIDVEVHLTARVKGDITIGLL